MPVPDEARRPEDRTTSEQLSFRPPADAFGEPTLPEAQRPIYDRAPSESPEGDS
jgi:hypothetical protein